MAQVQSRNASYPCMGFKINQIKTDFFPNLMTCKNVFENFHQNVTCSAFEITFNVISIV